MVSPKAGTCSSPPPKKNLPPGRCVPKGGHAPAGVTPAPSGPYRPPLSAVSHAHHAGSFCDSDSLCHSRANRRTALSPAKGSPRSDALSLCHSERSEETRLPEACVERNRAAKKPSLLGLNPSHLQRERFAEIPSTKLRAGFSTSLSDTLSLCHSERSEESRSFSYFFSSLRLPPSSRARSRVQSRRISP